MTNPFKSQMWLRSLMGVLSCILLGIMGYQFFSGAPADWTWLWPVLLLMAACAIQLSYLEGQGKPK